MFCRNCGAELGTEANFCKNCGTETSFSDINTPLTTTNSLIQTNIVTPTETGNIKKLCCPKCKSTDIHFSQTKDIVVNTHTKNFSSGLGCLGCLIAGPLGILCGLCGGGTTTSTTQNEQVVWVCKHCGNKFKDIDNINKEITATETFIKISTCTQVILWTFSIILQIIVFCINDGYFESSFHLFDLISTIILSISIYLWKNSLEKNRMALILEKEYLEKNAYK